MREGTSLQREGTIIEREREPLTVEEDNPWILGSPMTTSKMGSLNASIATSTDTWQRNADRKKRNKRSEHALNVTRSDTSPKTAKESRR